MPETPSLVAEICTAPPLDAVTRPVAETVATADRAAVLFSESIDSLRQDRSTCSSRAGWRWSASSLVSVASASMPPACSARAHRCANRYRINPALVVHFDAAIFEREIRAARRDPQRLEAAIALHGGDFLAGESVGDWHLDMHDRLRVQHVEALSTLADLRLAQGDAANAANVLERLLRSDGLREDAHRRLMLCYARAGQRDRALRQYERLVDVLRIELGAAPDRVTVELCDRLRRAEAV